MISRELTKKVNLVLEDNRSSGAEPIELEYYLLESEIADFEELEDYKTYGIEIVKRINHQNVEIQAVKNFSICKRTTQNLLERLSRNTVTPVSLNFIIDDLLGA